MDGKGSAMRISSGLTVVLCCLAVVLLAPPTAARAAELEEALPESTVVLVKVADWAKTRKDLDATALGGTDAFVKRGGHAGLTLSNDCMLLFGGVASFDALKTQGNATSDIYCPKLHVP